MSENKPKAKAEKVSPPPVNDSTHHMLAEHWLLARAIGLDHLPTHCGGQFYLPTREGLWMPQAIGRVEVEIGGMFPAERYCRKAADYRGIAAVAMNSVDDPSFFEHAPAGVATPAGFHRMSDDGTITVEPLVLSHRQAFRLQWAPDSSVEPVLMDRMLADALDGPDAEEQIDLMWQIIGALLFGHTARLQVCALFLGRERSGKSTIQQLLARMFPAEAVSAVSPSNWGREYFVASLAGKRLNLVGELDDAAPIPAAAFKNVTGGGLVEGRHPTHRPFFFIAATGHCFASNVLPATTDRSEAFFRRWRIVHFRHRVPDDAVDPDLVRKIVAHEMPGILARAFSAAQRVAQTGKLRTTASHDALVERWRHAANPVLQWLMDDEAIELDPQAAAVPNQRAFEHYRAWAGRTGFRNPLAKGRFLEILEATGPSRGVVVKRRAVHGLRLLGDA